MLMTTTQKQFQLSKTLVFTTSRATQLQSNTKRVYLKLLENLQKHKTQTQLNITSLSQFMNSSFTSILNLKGRFC